MQIVSIINNILQVQVAADVIKQAVYHTPTRGNVEVSRSKKMPMAVFTVITDRTVTIGKGWRETAKVVIDYLMDSNNPTTSFDGLSMEAKIDRMGDAATDFVARVMASDIRITDSSVMVTSLYDFADRNTTGVRISFNCEEKASHCYTITPIPEDEDNQQYTPTLRIAPADGR